MNDLPSIILKLDAVYNRAITATSDKHFFYSTYEYIDLFEETKALESVWRGIQKMADLDKKTLINLRKKAFLEMKRLYPAIKKHVANRGLTWYGVTEELDKYESYEKGELTSSLGKLKSQHGYLSYALMTLVDLGEEVDLEFCKQYGNIDERKQILGWNFSPSYSLWLEENKKLERLEPTKVWFNWNKLALLHEVIKNYEGLIEEQIKKDDLWNTWGLSMMYEEIDGILSGKQIDRNKIRYFIREDHTAYLQRLHEWVINVLSECMVDISNKTVKASWTYDAQSGIFSYGEKHISFQKDKRPGNLLKLLTGSEKNREKEWQNDVLFEEVEGLEPNANQVRQIYESAKSISIRLSSELHLNDFLICKVKTTQINPLYL